MRDPGDCLRSKPSRDKPLSGASTLSTCRSRRSSRESWGISSDTRRTGGGSVEGSHRPDLMSGVALRAAPAAPCRLSPTPPADPRCTHLDCFLGTRTSLRARFSKRSKRSFLGASSRGIFGVGLAPSSSSSSPSARASSAAGAGYHGFAGGRREDLDRAHLREQRHEPLDVGLIVGVHDDVERVRTAEDGGDAESCDASNSA